MKHNVRTFMLVLLLAWSQFGTADEVPVYTAHSAKCEDLLTLKINPEIDVALATFPSATVESKDRPEPRSKTPLDLEFDQALANLPPTLEAEQISFLTGGVELPFDLSRWIGVSVAGYFYTSPYDMFRISRDEEEPVFKMEYASGTITQVRSIWPDGNQDGVWMRKSYIMKMYEYTTFALTIRTPDGQEKELYYKIDDSISMLKLIIPKLSPEEKMRQALLNTDIDQWLKHAFGSTLINSDYEVGHILIEMMFKENLGLSGTVQVLRGLEGKIRDHENMGLLKQDRRYTPTTMKAFFELAEKFIRLYPSDESVSALVEAFAAKSKGDLKPKAPLKVGKSKKVASPREEYEDYIMRILTFENHKNAIDSSLKTLQGQNLNVNFRFHRLNNKKENYIKLVSKTTQRKDITFTHMVVPHGIIRAKYRDCDLNIYFSIVTRFDGSPQQFVNALEYLTVAPLNGKGTFVGRTVNELYAGIRSVCAQIEAKKASERGFSSAEPKG